MSSTGSNTLDCLGDAAGMEIERPNLRVVPKDDFDAVATTKKLVKRLFGAVCHVYVHALQQFPAGIYTDEESRCV